MKCQAQQSDAFSCLRPYCPRRRRPRFSLILSQPAAACLCPLPAAEMEVLHEEMPFDLDFHPSSPLVVTSLITGELCLYALRTANPKPSPSI